MSSPHPLQCPACGYRGNEETCPQCGFPLGQFRDFLSGIPVLADEAWKRELEELTQRHRTIYQERMAKERAIQALRQTAHRLEEQGNWAGALETYRQALELAQADPSLFSSAQEIKRAIQDVQRRYEQAQQETELKSKPKDKAAPGKISQDIWRSIIKLPFVEQLKVPGTGQEVKSKNILEKGKEYTIVARGSFSYRDNYDFKHIADAKDVLLINDAKLEPIVSDHNKHEYAFLITGAGECANFRIIKPENMALRFLFALEGSLLVEIREGCI